MITMKILVATDGSDPAKYAVEYAAQTAVEKKADLIIVSVIPQIPIMVGDGFTPNYRKVEEEFKEKVQKILEETADKIRKKFDIDVSIIIKKGSPTRKIIETADEEQVELIVVGNRGTGGILSWMLGNVSRSVVDACTMPVLVVKDQKYCKK
jgi:nucleotide-binding universal stress UspA family protein